MGLRGVRRRLEGRRLALQLTGAAKEFLGNAGYGPIYGARPLRHAVQQRLLDPLALRLLNGEFRRRREGAGDAGDGTPEVAPAGGRGDGP